MADRKNESVTDGSARKENPMLRRLLRMLPVFLVLAAIMTYCIVIVFTDGKQSKQKRRSIKGVLYTVRGITKNEDEIVAEIEQENAPFFLAEDDWEERFASFSEYTEEGRPAGNKLQISCSNLPDFVVEIDVLPRGRENKVTVLEKGKPVWETVVPVDWGGSDEEDSVWFYDMNADGYPELLAGEQELKDGKTVGVYDFYNRKGYTFDCGKDQYDLHTEYDSVAVWYRKFSTTWTISNGPYENPVRGTFVLNDGIRFEEKAFSYDDIETVQSDGNIYRWFDLDDGDEGTARAVRLQEYPNVVFVAERNYCYCRMAGGELRYIDPFSRVTEMFFYDVDNDGDREFFFADRGRGIGVRKLRWGELSFRAEDRMQDLAYGHYISESGHLLVETDGSPSAVQIPYQLQVIFLNETVKLLRDLRKGESFFWDGVSVVRIEAAPNVYYDMLGRMVYQETEDGLREYNLAKGPLYGVAPKDTAMYVDGYYLFYEAVSWAYFVDLNGDGIQEACIEYYDTGIIDMPTNMLVTSFSSAVGKFRWIDDELWLVSDNYNARTNQGRVYGRPVLSGTEIDVRR